MSSFTESYVRAAVVAANELGGLNGNPSNPRNDQYDAYRHAMLSADLTNIFGETISKMIMDDHEVGPLNDPQEKNMDLWNNNVGREEFKRWQQAYESGATSDSLRKWIYDKVKEGRTINDPMSDARKWVEPGDYDYYKRPEYNRESNRQIEGIKSGMKQASTIRSPILLDLDNDGIETTSQATGAYFDHQTDGFAERTGWASADDGLLVHDLNGNGTIDSGRELFGSETLLANGQKAANGFEALKQLDDNNDGQLNAQDAAYTTLQIWQDTDGDGYSQAEELHTLADLGIQSIATAYTTGATTDPQGNQHQQLGSYTTTAGQTRAATDVWFQADPTYSIATEWVDVPDAIAALPDATGYGKVRDLHQAMARDPGGALQQLVTQFTQTTNASQREDILISLIYHWTGVQNIDPKSRAARFIYGNVIGDARKLEALEEFMGQEWFGVWCWGTRDPNPHGRAAPVLLKAWDQLKELIGGQLMAQSHLKPLFDRITYTWDDAGQFPSNDSFWEKRA